MALHISQYGAGIWRVYGCIGKSINFFGKMKKLISIIVPIWNVESYLHRSIHSILSQTYRHLEVILVDDGSPDNCGRICDEYARKDERIKVIKELVQQDKQDLIWQQEIMCSFSIQMIMRMRT